MRHNSLWLLFGVVGVLSGGFLLLEELDARGRPQEVREERVHANLVRVRVGGRWEELQLMPLADHLCQSGNRLFDRYCDDGMSGQ